MRPVLDYVGSPAKPVLSKQDFVRRYQNGEFGNHSPTWDTIVYFEMWLNATHQIDTLVHLRNREKGGRTFYNIKAYDALVLWHRFSNPHLWYCSAMAPTEHTVFQGEVMLGPWGYNLTWTRVPLPMREALAESSFYCNGLCAKLLLQRHLNDLSWEWLQHLLETYQDHVVEFSVYDYCWGTHPGYNTIFWEVRKY